MTIGISCAHFCCFAFAILSLSLPPAQVFGACKMRLGEYDKSIADYDDSLKLIPKSAWSLYGRGIAMTHKNKLAEGEADMAAATAIWSPVEEQFKRRGIIP